MRRRKWFGAGKERYLWLPIEDADSGIGREEKRRFEIDVWMGGKDIGPLIFFFSLTGWEFLYSSSNHCPHEFPKRLKRFSNLRFMTVNILEC